MTRNRYKQIEYEGGFPVFLIEITWGGKIYRLAQYPMELNSDQGIIGYTGGLNEFQFKESSDFLDYDLEANIVSCSLIFDEVKVLKMISNGQVLEGSKAEFSMVIFKAGKFQKSYEDRIILMKGKVQEPQYGDPLDIDGSVSLSIEADPIDESRLIMNPLETIDQRFNNRDVDTADGKSWPIIIGTPNGSYSVNGIFNRLYCTPMYCYDKYTGVGSTGKFLISSGVVSSTSVMAQDDEFDLGTQPVFNSVDSTGHIYSYIGFDGFDTIATPSTVSPPQINGTSREWWVSFNEGGILNPFGDGILTGGGDICRWALQKTGLIIDDGAWANISTMLNKYQFSGYINDPTLGAWDWLAGNILPFLPISIRVGPQGIKPIYNNLQAISHVIPIKYISLNNIDDASEFTQISAVETIRATGELINRYTLNFGKSGHDQDYTQQVRVTNIQEQDIDILSEYSNVSINRYGIQETAEASDYIYERTTAEMIALQKVKSNSFPIRAFEISAPFHYGGLMIGDIIGVTSKFLEIEKIKMMIIAKEWTGILWNFKLAYQDNQIINIRK